VASQSKFPKPFFYLLITFGLIYLLGRAGALNWAKRLAERSLIIPGKQAVYDWQRKLKKSSDTCDLAAEKEIAELKVKIASLTDENLQQKRLLSAPVPKNWQFLGGKVIEVANETLTIDRGKQDEVREGMVAVTEGTYLGKVVKVSEAVAEIRLPTFFEEKLAVKIVSADDQVIFGRGLLVGRGQGKMRVEQILSREEIKKGDLVITTIEGGDLLVGEVEEIIEAKGEVFKTVQVKRLISPEELTAIFLIRKRI
jgi:rod shape-determining protein MreC